MTAIEQATQATAVITPPGVHIRDIRRAMNRSTRVVGEWFGVTRQTVERWETATTRGHRQPWPPDHAVDRMVTEAMQHVAEVDADLDRLFDGGIEVTGTVIRDIREGLGLSLADLAAAWGMNKQTVFRWETGIHPITNPEAIRGDLVGVITEHLAGVRAAIARART